MPQLETSATRWISERARALGFDLCGVAPAERFPELARYSEWLERGYAGDMAYLKDQRRADPRTAMSGVQSLIVCALNYNAPLPYSTETSPDPAGSPRGWISRYAWGDDYHLILWDRLNALCAEMKAHFPQPFEARAYADTGPLHERSAAKYAGLGWIGKNTLLLNQSIGSWFFLGAIVTTLPLAPSLGLAEAPPADRCGTCRRCIEACPTEAIVEPYVLDASRCIAYLTIELRGSIPEKHRSAIGSHVFGCDICQDVCPWNRKSPRTSASQFQPRKLAPDSEESLFSPDLLKLLQMPIEEFRRLFRGSPVKRAKWQGFVRNACIALGNSGLSPASDSYREALRVLTDLSHSSDSVVAESALWALSRIQATGQ